MTDRPAKHKKIQSKNGTESFFYMTQNPVQQQFSTKERILLHLTEKGGKSSVMGVEKSISYWHMGGCL